METSDPVYSSNYLNIGVNELSAEKSSFFTYGFVKIPSFCKESVLFCFEKEINKLIEDFASSSSFFCIKDKENFVVAMSNIDNESDFLFDFMRNRDVVEFIEFMLGKITVPLRSEYFCKPPYAPHDALRQDQAVYNEHFNKKALRICIALDELSLSYAKPSPTALLAHIDSSDISFLKELSADYKTNYVDILLKRGDCIAHNANALYKFNSNPTNSSKKMITFSYRHSPHKEWLKAQNSICR